MKKPLVYIIGRIGTLNEKKPIFSGICMVEYFIR